MVVPRKELGVAGISFRPPKSGEQNNRTDKQEPGGSYGASEIDLNSYYDSSEHPSCLNLVKGMLKLNTYKI